jgi:DeoR/GlpR family transcriptional regulator of sugar metabolism
VFPEKRKQQIREDQLREEKAAIAEVAAAMAQEGETVLLDAGSISLQIARLLNGVDLKEGLTTPNPLEAHTKKAMVKSAQEVIVVADHTRFGRVTVMQFCEIGDIHRLITDTGAPVDFVSALEERGVRAILADG